MTDRGNDGAAPIDVLQAFEIAIDLDPADLKMYAMELYKDDEPSRQRLLGMVRHHLQAEAEMLTAGGQLSTIERVIPENIGGYEIAGMIGEGGMGVVYLGHRNLEGLTQNVAIKVHSGSLDSTDARRRFLGERSILATLDHPYIAQIFDWGSSDDGRPYQVMEFIDGLPIDEYVAHHQCDTVKIVELVLDVCTAVEAAHRNLIIHRDIKATNVLITRDGLPKLIDFGIAKQLEDPTQTIASQLSFTPAYASPEQMRGEQLTTATDVYSIGALLFKLLTGKLPRDFARLSWQEAQDLVTHTGIEFPREIDSDMRDILATALHSDLARRYGTVAEFADDLRNYISQRPISARKDSAIYRAQKFIKRNAALSVAAFVVVVAVTAALSISLWQTRLAQIQLVRAERVTEFLSDLIVSPSPSIEASYQLSPDATLDQILTAAEADLAQDDSIPWDIRVELLNSISHSRMWLEQSEKAIQAQQVSVQIATLHKDESALALQHYIISLAFLAETYENNLEFDESIRVYEQAVQLGNANDMPVTVDWLNALNNYAFTLARANQWTKAKEIQQRVLDLSTQVWGSEPNPNRAIVLKNLAQMLLELGHKEQALEMITRAMTEYDGTTLKDPYTLLKIIRTQAWITYLLGDPLQAASLFESTSQITTLTYSYAQADLAIDRARAARLRINAGDKVLRQIDIIKASEQRIGEFATHPEAWPLHLAKATSSNLQGNIPASIAQAQRALKLAQENGATTSELAEIQAALQRFVNAAPVATDSAHAYTSTEPQTVRHTTTVN